MSIVFTREKDADVRRTWEKSIPCTCNDPIRCKRYHGSQVYPEQKLMSLEDLRKFWKQVFQHMFPVTYDEPQRVAEAVAIADWCFANSCLHPTE